MSSKKFKIIIENNKNIMKGIRISLPKIGGNMKSKGGKGSYNRKDKVWKKEVW